MADHCARCGQKVKSKENWMRVHLSASTVIFHFVASSRSLKPKAGSLARRRGKPTAMNTRTSKENAPRPGGIPGA